MLKSLDIRNPEKCRNMGEVRAGVDAVDAEMMGLLAERFAYMDAAARIKQDRNTVRDEARKREVIGNALANADRLGVPADLIADIWERLVEASIAYEFARWDELRA